MIWILQRKTQTTQHHPLLGAQRNVKENPEQRLLLDTHGALKITNNLWSCTIRAAHHSLDTEEGSTRYGWMQGYSLALSSDWQTRLVLFVTMVYYQILIWWSYRLWSLQPQARLWPLLNIHRTNRTFKGFHQVTKWPSHRPSETSEIQVRTSLPNAAKLHPARILLSLQKTERNY